MIDAQKIKKIEKKLGYTFRDKTLLLQAFTRTSYCNEHAREGYQSNQVLEFFGDSVLSCALITLLIRDFATRYEHGIRTELSEGDFSTLKSKLSDKTKLSCASDALGFGPFLLMGEGDIKMGVSGEPSVLEDLYESIIGAIWIDSGNDIGTVVRVVENTLDFRAFVRGTEEHVQSYKNALQEFCQDKHHRLPPPEYIPIDRLGQEHAPTYRVRCRVGDHAVTLGEGASIKKAENAAAKAALALLQKKEEPTKEEKSSRHPADSAVSRLQRHADAVHTPVTFSEARESEKSTKASPLFIVHCSFEEKTASAVASSKKEAKQKAAQKMLEKLGLCK